MRQVLLCLYESFRIVLIIAAAQSLGLFEWVANNMGWALAILIAMEYMLEIIKEEEE